MTQITPFAAVAILSLCLVGTAARAELDSRQATLLTTKCVQCHAVPGTTAPLMGRPEDWTSVIRQGEDATLRNVVEGIRGMPPLGYCSACSEQDLRALIRFVAGFPQAVRGDAP